MGEYGFLIGLGVVAVIAIYVGIKLRLKKDNKKRDLTAVGGKKRGKGKNGEEKFYQQEAYRDIGGGGGEYQDSDLYAMKEGKGGKVFTDDDYDPNKKKQKDEYESWDDY